MSKLSSHYRTNHKLKSQTNNERLVYLCRVSNHYWGYIKLYALAKDSELSVYVYRLHNKIYYTQRNKRNDHDYEIKPNGEVIRSE